MDSLQGRILVVEDDSVNQKILRAVLRKLGLEVDTADDGAQAVALCAAEHFDLVFMDLEMPGMNGWDATVAIRSREPPGRHIPIVAMTGYLPSEEPSWWRERGLDDFLIKPASREQIGAKLAQWLGGGGG